MFVCGVRAAETTFRYLYDSNSYLGWVVYIQSGGGLVGTGFVPRLVIDSEKRLIFDSPCIDGWHFGYICIHIPTSQIREYKKDMSELIIGKKVIYLTE